MSNSAMGFKELSGLFLKMYELSERNVHFPVIVWGEAGIGKSAAVKAAAQKIWGESWEQHVIDLRLGQMDAADLIGLPTDQEVYACPLCAEQGMMRPWTKGGMWGHLHDMHAPWLKAQRGEPGEVLARAIGLSKQKFPEAADTRTTYSIPEWFPSPESDGILFLDEINRTRGAVLQAVFQLLLDRRIHEAFLPKRWILVAASNPYDPKSYRTDEQRSIVADRALQSRFVHISMALDVEEWLTYISQTNVSESIVTYLIRQSKMIMPMGTANGVWIPNIFPTPRSVEIAAIFLEEALGDGMRSGSVPNWLEHVLVGTVGDAVTGEILAAGNADLPDPTKVFSQKPGKDVASLRLTADDVIDALVSASKSGKRLPTKEAAALLDTIARSELGMVRTILVGRLRNRFPDVYAALEKGVDAKKQPALWQIFNELGAA